MHSGPRAETLTVPLERMPIFARAGAIVPRQDYVDYTGRGAVRSADPQRLRRRRRPLQPLRGRGRRLRLRGRPVHAHAAALERGRRLGDARDRRRATAPTRATRRPAATACACSGSSGRARSASAGAQVGGYRYDADARLLTVETRALRDEAPGEPRLVRSAFGWPMADLIAVEAVDGISRRADPAPARERARPRAARGRRRGGRAACATQPPGGGRAHRLRASSSPAAST